MPHAETSKRRLRAGELLLLDFGASVGGYCSDMTRTVVLGRAKKWQRDLYNAVLEAQERALGSLTAGMRGRDVDTVARSCLISKGLGPGFMHGLGHGVGLQVHERPQLSRVSKDTLEKDSVFSVEPGAYLPGKGGERIEDLVWLSGRGPKVLTGSPKDLLEL